MFPVEDGVKTVQAPYAMEFFSVPSKLRVEMDREEHYLEAYHHDELTKEIVITIKLLSALVTYFYSLNFL